MVTSLSVKTSDSFGHDHSPANHAERPTSAARFTSQTLLTHLPAILFLFFSLVLAMPACGEALNARVRGSAKWFQQVLTKADSTICQEPTCIVPIRPTTLTIRTPISPHLKVLILSAKLAHPARAASPPARNQANARNDSPVLLRGILLADHRDSLQVPIAASISRTSSDSAVLNITAPLPRRTSHAAPQHLTSVTLPLSALNKLSPLNSRSKSPSRFAFSEIRCGVFQQRQLPQASRNRTQPEAVLSQATYPTLYIATDYDSLFASRSRCTSPAACNDTILRVLHTAAVFYEEQLGYTFTVARQFGPTSIGPTTLPSQVLDAAQQVSLIPRFSLMHTGANTAENQIDLFHFFTGRTMDEKTIGIAYVGTSCRNDRSEFAQAVIQHVSDELNPVIAAHETGHTLNALHTSSGIMRPNLSGKTPKSFSSKSLLAISGHLDAWYRECRQGFAEGLATPTSTPTPTPTPTPTRTPKPKPRGGGSSSSDPYIGKPVTVQIAVLSPAASTVSITATTTSTNSNCSVRIRAGTTSLGALRGVVLTEFIPTELSTTKSGSANFRVRPGGSKRAIVYFIAEHTCTDGTILEVSRVQQFNPNRVPGISRNERSKRAWLEALRRSIQ